MKDVEAVGSASKVHGFFILNDLTTERTEAKKAGQPQPAEWHVERISVSSNIPKTILRLVFEN
jgi:phage protein U